MEFNKWLLHFDSFLLWCLYPFYKSGNSWKSSNDTQKTAPRTISITDQYFFNKYYGPCIFVDTKNWYPPILSGIFCSVVMSIIAKFQKQTRQWFNISHLAYQSCLASWYLPFHLTRNRHPSAVFRQRISPDGTTLEKAGYKPCSARS